MQKWLVSFFIVILSSKVFSLDVAQILEKYPRPIYQDVIINDEVVIKGLNLCSVRYKRIKPVLEQFSRPFSVLDLGAAQGYFSFRIAYDYPQAHCTMIDENSSDYHYHGDLLQDLCEINHLDNVAYLRKRMSYADVCFLNQHEHFDVVLLFLVVHQMAEKLADQQMLLERLFSLGDNIIIEVANDVAVDLTEFVTRLSKYSNCEFLGEVPRFCDPRMPGKGSLFWFKQSASAACRQLSRTSFTTLNGVYQHALLD